VLHERAAADALERKRFPTVFDQTNALLPSKVKRRIQDQEVDHEVEVQEVEVQEVELEPAPEVTVESEVDVTGQRCSSVGR